MENNAERRLGIGSNQPAYLVASDVTKDGETYYAKVTRERAVEKLTQEQAGNKNGTSLDGVGRG